MSRFWRMYSYRVYLLYICWNDVKKTLFQYISYSTVYVRMIKCQNDQMSDTLCLFNIAIGNCPCIVFEMFMKSYIQNLFALFSSLEYAEILYVQYSTIILCSELKWTWVIVKCWYEALFESERGLCWFLLESVKKCNLHKMGTQQASGLYQWTFILNNMRTQDKSQVGSPRTRAMLGMLKWVQCMYANKE